MMTVRGGNFTDFAARATKGCWSSGKRFSNGTWFLLQSTATVASPFIRPSYPSFSFLLHPSVLLFLSHSLLLLIESTLSVYPILFSQSLYLTPFWLPIFPDMFFFLLSLFDLRLEILLYFSFCSWLPFCHSHFHQPLFVPSYVKRKPSEVTA